MRLASERDYDAVFLLLRTDEPVGSVSFSCVTWDAEHTCLFGCTSLDGGWMMVIFDEQTR